MTAAGALRTMRPKMSARIAIVGCGTVGGATALHLLQSEREIEARYGCEVTLAAVVDRELTHARAIGLPEELLTTELGPILDDSSIDTLIELVGGIDFAFDLIAQALRAGKNVVTANKALLAHRGVDLFAIARESGRALAFEASCGGGIPALRAIFDGLAGNRIDAIYGIVNGTCNYILTQMIDQGISYDEALAEAQRDGLAEADPTLDVTGVDSAHKIAIMAALAFGVRVDFDAIPVKGINVLSIDDVDWATRLGYVPKLLAIAERGEEGVNLRVRPAFVTDHHPLAWVGGPFNAVSIYSFPTGHTLYYGRGAGGSATAGAIVADAIALATGAYQRFFLGSRFWPDQTDATKQTSLGSINARYYVRVQVEDRPGVLAEITQRYGKHNISIASVHQDEIPDDSLEPASIVVVTHGANEQNLMNAVEEINALPQIKSPCAVVPIVDEPDEQLLELPTK